MRPSAGNDARRRLDRCRRRGVSFDDDGTLSIWRTEATLGVHLSDRLRAIFALKAEEWPQSSVLVTAPRPWC
jgi:hypothetical protein